MLLHLTLGNGREATLINPRRPGKSFSTYPTSPSAVKVVVANAMRALLSRPLVLTDGRKRQLLGFAVVDPAMESGQLLLGVKIESPEGVSNVEQILSVPGLGFAEMGPGDLGLALGYKQVPREPYPPEMQEARERVFAACCARGIPFLETCTPENVAHKIDEGVRVIAGHREETAQVGRAHTKRTMPV